MISTGKVSPTDGAEGVGTRLAVEGGRYVLHTSPETVRLGRDRLRNHLHRYIAAYLNPLPADTYVRVSHYREDYEHLAAGTHRGSINHHTGEAEGGLSVALSPEFPATVHYYVTGRAIGQGADGEPLLDVATAQPASRPMSWRHIQADYRRRLARKLRALGISEEAYRQLASVPKLIWPE